MNDFIVSDFVTKTGVDLYIVEAMLDSDTVVCKNTANEQQVEIPARLLRRPTPDECISGQKRAADAMDALTRLAIPPRL